MTGQWWVGVRQRVDAIGAGPAGSKVFGAWGHEWVVEDPLTQGELAELEAQMGVRLPEEYRACSRSACGARAGACGLVSLKTVLPSNVAPLSTENIRSSCGFPDPLQASRNALSALEELIIGRYWWRHAR
ncbi:SMI1/KNR4 family protein [Streptoverticillium reticulum]|uniref:SMI1/KNR4 family protein n=1 Tax=Streptoverticillium reticulum TaxID=1433415 RepID=UPI0039BFC804